MKAIKQNDGSYLISKGKTEFKIYPGQDHYPSLPTRIVYEGQTYPTKDNSILRVVKAFEDAYSEERVLEILLGLIF